MSDLIYNQQYFSQKGNSVPVLQYHKVHSCFRLHHLFVLLHSFVPSHTAPIPFKNPQVNHVRQNMHVGCVEIAFQKRLKCTNLCG